MPALLVSVRALLVVNNITYVPRVPCYVVDIGKRVSLINVSRIGGAIVLQPSILRSMYSTMNTQSWLVMTKISLNRRFLHIFTSLVKVHQFTKRRGVSISSDLILSKTGVRNPYLESLQPSWQIATPKITLAKTKWLSQNRRHKQEHTYRMTCFVGTGTTPVIIGPQKALVCSCSSRYWQAKNP